MGEEKVLIKQREVGARYPSIDLESAVTSVDRLKKSLGKGPYVRENAVKGLGYNTISGTSSTRLAALVHYGLLTKVDNAYSISTLANRILLPLDDSDKNQAIRVAALTPKIYRAVLQDFRNQALPSLLKNILAQKYRINEAASPRLVENLKKTFIFAGLLTNGIVGADEGYTDKETPSSIGSTSTQEPSNQSAQINTPDKSRRVVTTTEQYVIPLPSGISVAFPQSMAYRVTLGEFADTIRQLEKLAQVTSDHPNENPQQEH